MNIRFLYDFDWLILIQTHSFYFTMVTVKVFLKAFFYFIEYSQSTIYDLMMCLIKLITYFISNLNNYDNLCY